MKGQGPAEPFRIAGNLYYVGASDLTAFLLTGPEGDVLIGGGYSTAAPLIMASIAQLGFDIANVKVLLNSDALDGQAAARTALAAMQRRRAVGQ
jgi:metallo-beta-lactamase class B